MISLVITTLASYNSPAPRSLGLMPADGGGSFAVAAVSRASVDRIPWLAPLWAAGVILMSLRLAVGWLGARRLVRLAGPPLPAAVTVPQEAPPAPPKAPAAPAKPSVPDREHDRRIDYANQRYGEGATPGSQTERGRLYVRYGPPDEITVHGGYERWFYRRIAGVGNNVSFEFGLDRKPSTVQGDPEHRTSKARTRACP